ncbi:SRPBCC family protein [Actinosynnema sp. NPDC050436]|uniref:SRPBCC family protein n=1 Tax=Actinosynnema sp. NPDC050436 TaxID=3155659 RepID=UPI00340E89DA
MTSRPPRRLAGARAALLALPLAAGLLGAAAPPASADTPDRTTVPTRTAGTDTAPLTCRGEGVDPAARIRYRTETLVDAPMSTVWKLQTDVARWPSWQPPVTGAERLDHGPLRPRSQFRWTTPVPATPTTPATTLVITSTVQQLRHERCLRWTGPAIGEGLTIDRGVHVWTFTRVHGGVLVRTEETWTGAQVEADVPTSVHFLGEGLKAWLADLKTTAEARHCD